MGRVPSTIWLVDAVNNRITLCVDISISSIFLYDEQLAVFFPITGKQKNKSRNSCEQLN